MNLQALYGRGLLALILVSLMVGCGGGQGASGVSNPSTGTAITSVTVSCGSISVQVTHTLQCSASVLGTGAFSSAVVWSAQGGGSVNATGLYGAPNLVPNPSQIVVTATSVQDSTKFGNAPTTITPRTSLVFSTPVNLDRGQWQ
jgi:hypothetical protein